jgi:cysteine desulfurase
MRVYLDFAATTPLDPVVEEAMRPFHAMPGNPSSVHREGSLAREALEDARERLAVVLGAHSQELIFTGGGTEANNQVIFGFGLHHDSATPVHIVTTAVEHSAILAPARALEAMARATVTYLEPDEFGSVTAQQVADALRLETRLVSVQHVNNEVGTIQPIREIAGRTQARGVPLHVDAVQSLGYVPLNVTELGCDLLTISAHKFHGPKGIGALFVNRDLERKRGVQLPPLLYGGHQERGLRGGTHNLPSAVGMALAAERASALQPSESARLEGLRDAFTARLLEIDGVTLNGHPTRRSPRHVNITARDADGEALLMNLDLEGVAASSGSACSAGTLEPSHVLTAMGRNASEARASVRFSLGRETTLEQLEFAVMAFRKAYERSRV